MHARHLVVACSGLVLAGLLAGMPSLSSLSLYGNSLGNEAVSAMADALKVSASPPLRATVVTCNL